MPGKESQVDFPSLPAKKQETPQPSVDSQNVNLPNNEIQKDTVEEEVPSKPVSKQEKVEELLKQFDALLPEEKMHFVEDIINTLGIREEKRAEARYRRGFIGKISWRLNRFLENDPRGRAVKIASKVILGGAAAATAIGLAGTAGLALSPLLFAMGTKVGSSGIIETIQEFSSLGKSRRALAEYKIAFEADSAEMVKKIKEIHDSLQSNEGMDKFFNYFRSQLTGIQEKENFIVEQENEDIKLAARQKKWRGALSTGVSVAAGMMMGVPFGAQHFRGIPPVYEGGKITAGAINNPHEVIYHVGKGWEFMYNNAAELVGRQVTTNSIIPGFMAHVLGHLPPQAANWGLGMMAGGLVAKTAEELFASNAPVGSSESAESGIGISGNSGTNSKETPSVAPIIDPDNKGGPDEPNVPENEQENGLEKENKGELIFDSVLKYLREKKPELYKNFFLSYEDKNKDYLKKIFEFADRRKPKDILESLKEEMYKSLVNKEQDGGKKMTKEKEVNAFITELDDVMKKRPNKGEFEEKIIKFFLLMQIPNFSSGYSPEIKCSDLINVPDNSFNADKFNENKIKYEDTIENIKKPLNKDKDYSEEGGWIHFNANKVDKIQGRVYISAKLDQDPAEVLAKWREALEDSNLSKEIYYKITPTLSNGRETIVVYLNNKQNTQINDDKSDLNKLLSNFSKNCGKDDLLMDDFPSTVNLKKGIFYAPEPIRANKIRTFLGRKGQISYHEFIADALNESLFLAMDELKYAEDKYIKEEELKARARSIFIEIIEASGIDSKTMQNYSSENKD